MATTVHPYNMPITLDGSFGPLAETLDINHFDFDVVFGRIPISAKGGAVGGNLDIAVSSPLIDSADSPVALPLAKPVQIKNFHLTAHVGYGQTAPTQIWDSVEVKDLGLALSMGRSVVNMKGTAARGIAYITAASAEVTTEDLPVALPLSRPVTIKNLHLSARAKYPPKEALSALELADVPDFGLALVMGDSTADIQGTLKGGLAHATIASQSLNTGDLPIAVPLKKSVRISGLQATLEGTAQEARLNNLVFEVFGGAVKGQGRMGLGSVAPPFQAKFAAEGLKLGAMKGRGLTMPDLTKALEGTGAIALKNGTLQGLKLMQEVTALLKVAGLPPEEIKATVFSGMNGDFVVRQGLVTVQRLLVDSPDFQATGNGTIGLDQSVHLRMNMNLSPSLSRRIATASPIAHIALSEGRLSVPLLIDGTIQSPSYRLDTRMFTGKIQEQAKRKAREAVEELLEGKTDSEDLRQQGKSLLKDLFRR
jgi:AsmA protein